MPANYRKYRSLSTALFLKPLSTFSARMCNCPRFTEEDAEARESGRAGERHGRLGGGGRVVVSGVRPRFAWLKVRAVSMSPGS